MRRSISFAIVCALALSLVGPLPPAAAAGADIPTASPLIIGETQDAAVDASTGHSNEVWGVHLTEGEEVTITIRGTGVAGSEATATLLAPGIGSISQLSQFAIYKSRLRKGEYFSTIADYAYTPAKTGTYYIHVTTGGGPFAYTIGVARTSAPAIVAEDSDDISGFVPAGPGVRQGIVEGRTDPDDVYGVQLTAGQPVSFRLEAADMNSSKGGGCWLDLLDRTSTSIGSYSTYHRLQYKQVFNYTSPTTTDTVAVIDFTPAVSGVYYLWVNQPTFIHSMPYTLTISGAATMPRRPTSFTMRYLSGATTVANGKGVAFEGLLGGSPSGIVTVNLQHSADGRTWSNVFPTPVVPASAGTYRSAVYIYRNRYYRWRFDGNADYAPCVSRAIRVYTHARLTVPYAPATAYRGRYFTSFGTVTRHTAGSRPVAVRAYRYVSGRWVLYGTYKAVAANYTSLLSRYSVRIALPYRGTWRLIAYHSDTDHLATTSSYRQFVVK